MHLIITHMCGPRDGEAMRIEATGSPPAVTFGRQRTCAVSLPDDSELSRRHACLSWREGNWWLEDLGSTNGSFVGEFAQQHKVTGAVRIAPGIVFRVGLSRFRIGSPETLKSAHFFKAERVY